MNDTPTDIELERQLVEENSEHVNTESDDLTPEEQHRRAQESGEVFEGQRYGGL